MSLTQIKARRTRARVATLISGDAGPRNTEAGIAMNGPPDSESGPRHRDRHLAKEPTNIVPQTAVDQIVSAAMANIDEEHWLFTVATYAMYGSHGADHAPDDLAAAMRRVCGHAPTPADWRRLHLEVLTAIRALWARQVQP